MADIEKIKEEYKIGQAIFQELFKLKDSELKEKINDITDSKYEVIINNSDCTRIIVNEKPNKIKFNYYSDIIIDWSGILYQPEHGYEQIIVKFNKNFKL